MANENTGVEILALEEPICSTDNVWYKGNTDESLSDHLDGIEADIAALESGKASTTHSHTGYAAATHTHTQDDISGLTDTLNNKAGIIHTHTGYAAENHTHTPASLGAAPASHSHDYAAPTHSHATTDVNGLVDALATKADGNHTHVVYGSTGASTYKKVWIATTGNDDNDGTAAAPMATITGAIRKYSPQYKMLDISLADGTYTENLGSISADLVNLAIRSNSENKDGVTINMTTALEVNIPIVRLYNVTFNVTVTGIRPAVVTGGILYAYNVRFAVPEGSSVSCVNVYNGCSAMLMHCVLNAGTSNNSAGVYGNQAGTIKAINCTSERTVAIGFYAHNGSDIEYTDTITAATKTKVTYYGKCTVRT